MSFSPGTKVRITLTESSYFYRQYNNVTGVVNSWDGFFGQYNVTLAGGNRVYIDPDCLVPLKKKQDIQKKITEEAIEFLKTIS